MRGRLSAPSSVGDHQRNSLAALRSLGADPRARRTTVSSDDLPPGWIRKESKSKPGAVYYAHLATGRTQVDPPKAAVPPPVANNTGKESKDAVLLRKLQQDREDKKREAEEKRVAQEAAARNEEEEARRKAEEDAARKEEEEVRRKEEEARRKEIEKDAAAEETASQAATVPEREQAQLKADAARTPALETLATAITPESIDAARQTASDKLKITLESGVADADVTMAQERATAYQMRAELGVTVTGEEWGKCYAPVTSFEKLGLPDYALEALVSMGIEKPLPVQAQALPIALAGHDLIGIARTGSGKTLAYLLPALGHIEKQECVEKKDGVPRPIALVLAPTRELVVQISEEATKLVRRSRGWSKHWGGLWPCCVYGGKSKHEQIRLARKGAHIMAATPGRLVDNIQNGEISMECVSYFVLDEADRMLEEGFAGPLRQIGQQVREDRHMLFFSATWPAVVDKLAGDICRGERLPIRLAVGQRHDGTVSVRDGIVQEIRMFHQQTWQERDAAKKKVLYKYLREKLKNPGNKVLVFVSNKILADELRDTLLNDGITADSIHGGHRQDMRQQSLEKFKKGETRLLVATDVMGRGLDIVGISHVVIYDMGEIEDYVHRIGRTARGVNAEGNALVLFEYNERRPHIAKGLVQVLDAAGQTVPETLRMLANGQDVSAWVRGWSNQEDEKPELPLEAPPAPVIPMTYWQYRWCDSASGEIFGPFDGATMQGWQEANMFAANPAHARCCAVGGQPLVGEDWQPADRAAFLPNADLWHSSRKRHADPNSQEPAKRQSV